MLSPLGYTALTRPGVPMLGYEHGSWAAVQ